MENRKIEVPFCMTLKTLFIRAYLNIIRNPRFMRMRFIQTILVALFMGGVYYQFSGEYLTLLNWRALNGFLTSISIGGVMMSMGPIGLSFPS